MSRRQRSDAQSTSGLEGVSRGVNVGVNECINDWKKFQLALEKGMKSCESVAEDLLVSQYPIWLYKRSHAHHAFPIPFHYSIPYDIKLYTIIHIKSSHAVAQLE